MSRKPPPADDASQGGKNEYIPSFISKKPFYISEETTDEDYLEHQRLQSAPQDTLDKAKWYDRGRKLGPAATKFRKGACENCGAMTHKTKECLSRPRKQGAKWTGRDIQADEVVEEVKLGWDAKRDRWNGYDAREYSAVVKEYEELEAIKKTAAGSSDRKSQEDGEEESQNEDARYTEETDMGRSQPTSTRQLRLREDTAKYLVNLDLDSARYDPKTRSMDTSTQDLNAADPSSSLAEEGFTRAASDAAEFERAQRYAWETQEKASGAGRKLHLQANPTEGEVLRKKQTQAAAEKKAAERKALLERYGGAEHLAAADAPIHRLQVQENQRYVEYDESGAVKGAEKKIARSKYAEDVLVNNHTSTWGSWWSNFQWGYQCCHSFVKNSYCTGEEGRKAFEQAEQMRMGDLLLLENGEQAEQAMPEQDADHAQESKDEIMGATAITKKRTLQEMREGITSEEMEGYKRNRVAADDPMANLRVGQDGLVQ